MSQASRPDSQRTLRSVMVWLVLAGLSLLAQGASAQAAFTCDDAFYQSQVQNSTSSTTIYRLNRGTVPYSFTQVFSPALSGTYNGLSYNPVDNYLYIFRQSDGQLVQMGPAGVVTSTAANAQLVNANGATFDNQGRMFASNESVLYRVTNLPPAAGGIAILPITRILGETSVPAGYGASTSFLAGDLAVDINQSTTAQVVLYGTRSVQSGAMYLYRIRVADADSATPTAYVSRVTSNVPTAATIGSVWIDASGRMFAYNNSSSRTEGFYEINTRPGSPPRSAAVPRSAAAMAPTARAPRSPCNRH